MTVLDRFDLTGRVAVVTGGGGFLGVQHCEALVEAGASVAAIDLDLTAWEKFRDRVAPNHADRLFGHAGDITNRAAVQDAQAAIHAHFGDHPQILINNAAIDAKFDSARAGSLHPSRLETFSITQWDREIRVGLTGALLCSQVFGAEMAHRGAGVILNVASDLGIIAPDQRIYRKPDVEAAEQPVKPVTYSVIKHGLIGLTRYLATYWAEAGVRCNALAPGGVFRDHPESFVDALTARIPLGRMAEPGEYKAAVVFLCSDASSYATGSVVSLDGGRTAW